MPAAGRVGTDGLEQGRRYIDRRSFLRMSAAALGATAGIVAAHWLPVEVVAFAGEPTANKEKRKKDAPSKGLLAARCPVTDDAVSKKFSIDYRLGKLYFCSAECIEKFRADRSTYEAKANAQLVITGHFRQTRCPVNVKEIAPAIKTKICGVDVCFCSADCAKKVRRAPADKRPELVFVEGFDKGFATRQAKTAGSAGSAAEKWQCADCGHVHTGSSPPATCPQCGAKSDAFTPVS